MTFQNKGDARHKKFIQSSNSKKYHGEDNKSQHCRRGHQTHRSTLSDTIRHCGLIIAVLAVLAVLLVLVSSAVRSRRNMLWIFV